MGSLSEPLLASNRASSEQSDDSPEDGLLRKDWKQIRHAKATRKGDWIRVGLGVWAGLATLAVIAVAYVCVPNRGAMETTFPPKGKRNVVFMVSDGMGPTSLTMTRSFLQHVKHLPWGQQLALDKSLIGTSRTRSTSSLVTDSAAGATAFSCGLKSYNGAISVLPDGTPCGTVLEAAKLAGYKTGLVVTTRLTDATPACFSAHVNLRSEEDRIAEQQLGDYPLGLMLDLALGGGRCHFLPNSTLGSCRADDRDMVSYAKKKHGFHYVDDRAGFDRLKKGKAVSLPLLGLFAPTDIPFDLDREDSDFPSLDEMAEVALNALEAATKDSEQGFFLMVEGSRIDHAGHSNDPAAQVHEVLAYDKTFARVLKWVESHDAVLVSTSDHETGGLATARQIHETYPDYLWYPEVLANASHSSAYLASAYRDYNPSTSDSKEDEFIRTTLLKEGSGIVDASEDEIKVLKAHKLDSEWAFSDMLSRRAQIGWSTHGHSGVDVNIYGSKGTERLHGNRENTEIGQFLADYLELDLKKVTSLLREKGDAKTDEGAKYEWMGRSLEELKKDSADVLNFHKDELDHYHGDFKRCLH